MLHKFFVLLEYDFLPGFVRSVLFETEAPIKTSDEFFQCFWKYSDEIPMTGRCDTRVAEKVLDKIAADYKGTWRYITFDVNIIHTEYARRKAYVDAHCDAPDLRSLYNIDNARSYNIEVFVPVNKQSD